MTTAAEEILTKAIEYWQTKGWCQGESVDLQGRRCLVGGIQHATCLGELDRSSLIERDKALAAVADVIGGVPAYKTTGETCVEWNDTRGRTVEEVITAAEQARANLKAAE